MRTIKEAIELFMNNIQPRKVVFVGLDECLSMYLAEDIVAPEPSPRYTNSAMDGYAIKLKKTVSPDSVLAEAEYLP